jgi:hypothetical protein
LRSLHYCNQCQETLGNTESHYQWFAQSFVADPGEEASPSVGVGNGEFDPLPTGNGVGNEYKLI